MTTTTKTASASAKMTLDTKISKASQNDYFIRITEKDPELGPVTSMTGKIDGLVKGCKTNPQQIWCQSARLIGNVDVLERMCDEVHAERLQLSHKMIEIIRYDIDHALTDKSCEADDARDAWGFTADHQLVKLRRSTYRSLFSTELKRVKEAKAKAAEERELNAPCLSDLRKIVAEIDKNPGSWDIVSSRLGTATIKSFSIGTEQKRPPVKSDLVQRVETANSNGTFLNVTGMTETGSGSRTATSKTRDSISFSSKDKPALKSVFFKRPKDGEDATGAIQFLSQYYKKKGMTVSIDAVKRDVLRAIETTPKMETTSSLRGSGRVATHVCERNDLPIEPTSPRARANFDGPGDY